MDLGCRTLTRMTDGQAAAGYAAALGGVAAAIAGLGTPAWSSSGSVGWLLPGLVGGWLGGFLSGSRAGVLTTAVLGALGGGAGALFLPALGIVLTGLPDWAAPAGCACGLALAAGMLTGE